MDGLSVAQLERVLVDALDLSAGGTLTDTPDWVQLRSPASVHGNVNCVCLARLEVSTVETRIQGVMEEHIERGAALRWIVGPGSSPADLSARLSAAGVPHIGSALGMSLCVDHARVSGSGSGSGALVGLEFLPVTLANAARYGLITQRGWAGSEGESGDGAMRAAAITTIVRALRAGDGQYQAWIAELEGVAVGVHVLRTLGDIGYLQGAAVLPEFRRRGIYGAMIEHRLGVLAGAGVPWAVIWANPETSAGVCRRVGFSAHCRAEFHERPAPDPVSDPVSDLA